MEKIVIDLEAKTDKAISEIEELRKEIAELNKTATEGNKKTEKSFGILGKTLKALNAPLKGISTIFKGALGAGIVIKAFGQLKEIFASNQKVADVFATAIEFLSIAFNDLVNFVVGNSSAVVNTFKAFFQDPLQGIKNFGKAIKDNVIERMNSALETLGFLASAVKKVFAGDFAGALEDAKSAGKELVDVVTGVDDSFNKLTPIVSNYVAEAVKAAQANVELGKQAEIAAVRQQGIIESFDLQAEKLRQVRDEERNTIEERIAANNKLKETLDEQEEAMLKQVDLQIRAAQAEYDKNQNQENTIRLLEAQQEKEAVLAQIAGFRSEQLSNDLALNREKLELEQSISDAEAERAINEATFNAEQIQNEYLRLQALRDVAEQEKVIEETRLTEKMNSYKVGTQAFQDAQNELLQFQQENGQQQKELERDVNKAKAEEVTNALGSIAGIVGQNSSFAKSAGGGTSTPTAPASQPPAFNIVGASGTNQLAETIAGQNERPVKAFVTSQDVTTAQSLERNIVDGASI